MIITPSVLFTRYAPWLRYVRVERLVLCTHRMSRVSSGGTCQLWFADAWWTDALPGSEHPTAASTWIHQCQMHCGYLVFKCATRCFGKVNLARARLQTIPSSVLYAGVSRRQHYATGCCVTLLYVMWFSPLKETPVTGLNWLPSGRGLPLAGTTSRSCSLTLIGSSDRSALPPSSPPPSAAAWMLRSVLLIGWRWTNVPNSHIVPVSSGWGGYLDWIYLT